MTTNINHVFQDKYQLCPYEEQSKNMRMNMVKIFNIFLLLFIYMFISGTLIIFFPMLSPCIRRMQATFLTVWLTENICQAFTGPKSSYCSGHPR